MEAAPRRPSPNPSELGTGDLLARWRGGDLGAFEALVERFEGALLRHATALLGRGAGAEDIVQEAFLRLAEVPPVPAPSGDGHGALQAWLHRVVRNRCTDEMRSSQSRRERERRAALDESTEGGQRAVDQADTQEAVRRGLETLPVDQREVLTLRLLGGHSYREIADLTGKKSGTIGWLVSVGLEALSRELAPLLGLGSADLPGQA
ncbi:MAG: RNA polymerase sigma factor [Planctomycetota bacterium]|nr:RNA polymerase sigma factor [Planctomycetota bacterium]